MMMTMKMSMMKTFCNNINKVNEGFKEEALEIRYLVRI